MLARLPALFVQYCESILVKALPIVKQTKKREENREQREKKEKEKDKKEMSLLGKGCLAVQLN